MKTETASHKHTNHLINENSPYLLAHAHNPVNWYPWGDEALALAKEQDKPIFLSIGYSACHWCHVMERESFENEAIAAILNEQFISIKVDREQRPDLDQIYMAFTSAMTGGGGWPMSVFLTPELKPFYAGTYFPPEDRYGRPGFKSLITNIGNAYKTQKAEIFSSSESLFTQMSDQLSQEGTTVALNKEMPANGAKALMRSADKTYGGFGNDRKFPHATEISLFMLHFKQTGDSAYLKAAEKALMAMNDGGLNDHLGGGFARYSVDRQWLVPHFEKMLYDNAMLVATYAEAYQLTGRADYLSAVTNTLDFVLREMTDKTGGFYSALDADSEGEEGKYYVWSKAEIEEILGEDATLFNSYYAITDNGNFEGHNIIRLNNRSDEFRGRAGLDDFEGWLANCKQKLFDVRAKRIRPKTDDKILTSWNGLMIRAFALGYQVTGDERYRQAAVKNATFVKNDLYDGSSLTHAYREGLSSSGTFLEDYAFYLAGLIELYQIDPEHGTAWLKMAESMALGAIDRFMAKNGVLYLRESGLDDLIIRPRDEYDGALPAPGSVLIGSLLKLHRLTENEKFIKAAELGFAAVSGKMVERPGSMAAALTALDYYYGEKIEVIIVGNDKQRQELVREVFSRYIPHRLIAISNDGKEAMPMFKGRESSGDEALAYLCRNSACLLPVSSVEKLIAQLDQLN